MLPTFSSVTSSVNATLTVGIQAEAYNIVLGNGDVTTINDNNTANIIYEQQSREFYQSYDPSVGLHTAAFLGGILVWLVIYVIYRTKVRKNIIRLFKKTFGDEDEMDTKVSENKNSSGDVNPAMVQTMVNPSIVIESSPPHSNPQSPSLYDLQSKESCQECFSAHSLPGIRIDDDMGSQFPCFGQAGPDQTMYHYHLQHCAAHHKTFIQVPKSEIDVPSATAQWVQNMPLAARSYQDFANLMVSMQSYGLLSMNKPCSCPLVCPRTPQPLSLLDMPNSWNKSLPVLSNSLSSQILSAYEAVINNSSKDKDIKDIINARRKWLKTRHGSGRCDVFLKEKNLNNLDSNSRNSHIGVTRDTDTRTSRTPKTSPDLTTEILDTAENINSFNISRSTVPFPFTPTVMIHNSKPIRLRRGCDSNTSISSTSSTDLPLTSSLSRASKPPSRRLPSPHLLSPMCDNRSRNQNVVRNCGDIKRYHTGKDISRSASASLHSSGNNFSTCSFKYHKGNNIKNTNLYSSNNECSFYRISTSSSGNLNSMTNSDKTIHYKGCMSHSCHSLHDFSYNTDFRLNPNLHTRQNHESLSADVTFSLNLKPEHGGSAYLNESNRNSLEPRPQTPSPHLLQVPDSNSFFRPVTPEFGAKNKFYMDMYSIGAQPIRHCVHSDSNIVYNAGPVDRLPITPYSTVTIATGQGNRSFIGDNSVPASSPGSSGTHCLSYRHHVANPDTRFLSHHHHSTGMLGVSTGTHQHRILHSHCCQSRPFSTSMMETKL